MNTYSIISKELNLDDLGEISEVEMARIQSIIDSELDHHLMGLFFPPSSPIGMGAYRAYNFGKSFILKGVV